MTWQEVKDFLDHMRTTCMDDRTALKLEVRKLRQENARLIAQHDGLVYCPKCGASCYPNPGEVVTFCAACGHDEDEHSDGQADA